MTRLLPESVSEGLRRKPRRWLVTGAAGFIGSNLVEALLDAGQEVVGFDNFATGHQRNLDEVGAAAGAFRFVRGDIRDREACRAIVADIDVVLHQAALGSVPRSMADPLTSHDVNVTGFVNMLDAARDAGVRRFVYAASSSTYGDDTSMPKREAVTGRPMSPYAVTKLVNEIYAEVYASAFGYKATGLRYFNVFGPRQDPDGAYAAVIPHWIKAMIGDAELVINGDGETSRDFCYVANAVQANVLAAIAPDDVQGEVFNIAAGGRTSLNQLFELLNTTLQHHQVAYHRQPVHGAFRPGDVRHTQADIGKAQAMLGFAPTHDLAAGLAQAMPWYLNLFASAARG